MRLAWLFWPLLAGQFLLIATVLTTLFASREARLTVQATTEILSLHVAAGEVLDGWGDLKPIRSLTTMGTCSNPLVTLEPQIAGPVDVVIKTSSEGGLDLSLESEGALLGTVICGSRSEAVNSSLILSWDSSRATPLALPFRGHLTLGGDVNSGTSNPRLLLDGTVRVEASSAPFGNGQVTSENKLYAGDRFYLSTGALKDDQAVAHGIISVRDKQAMQVTAHATAAAAKVLHYGQTDFVGTSYAPTFWAKIQAQPEWALLLVLVPILLNMLTGLQTYLVERGIERFSPERDEDAV